MAHIALVCPPFYSHVRVFEALASALSTCGHRTTFLLNAGAGSLLTKGQPVAEVAAHGARDLGAILARAARPNGPFGVLRTVGDGAALTEALCREGPDLLRALGIDAVVGDQMEPGASLIAGHLRLPFASIACSVPLDPAPGVPLPFLGWPYDPSPEGLKRNRGGERIARLLLWRQRAAIARWSKRFGLPPRRSMEACLSPTLRISQMVTAFDFPRPFLPPVHAVGPIRQRDVSSYPMPSGIDPAKPLVFASFGTLQGHRLGLFQAIAGACRRLGVELLVAHCGGLSPEEAARIEGAVVTDFAPQAEVLARAAVCVTHGGLNTVLDSLQVGVPVLTIPIAFDQPGVGARVAHHGVGQTLSRVLLSSRRIEASLSALLATATYRENAARIGRDITASGGADLAAKLMGEALFKRSERAA